MLLQIFDGAGKLVKEKQLDENSSISTQEFLSGNYVYRILDGQKNTVIKTGKIIVL